MSNLTDRIGGRRASLAWKAPVRVATTSNISLTGFQTIDGVALAAGDANLRVLVKDQTDATENGIYDVKATAWTRAKDFAGSDDIEKGTSVYVGSGTVGVGWYYVSSSDPIVIGTDDINISVSRIASRGAGLDYIWSSSTSGDPGSGFGLGSSTTLSAITSINLSETGRAGQSYASRIAAWAAGERLLIYDVADESTFLDVQLTGAAIDAGTYCTIAVTVIGSSGTLAGKLVGVISNPSSVPGSLTKDYEAERDGIGVRLRNVHSVLSSLDRKGFTGPGNADFLPTTQNLSQSGTTVTAGSAIFRAEHVGKIIEWASGEQALIVTVPLTSGSGYAAVSTCTVDRSQTIVSSSSTINAKSLVEVIFGNSVSHPVMRSLVRKRWREIGFGGYIFSAGNVDSTQLSIATATVSGGASESATGSTYSQVPWSASWSMPNGGSLEWYITGKYANGSLSRLSHGIQQEDQLTDTAILVYRREAGALTVYRKRDMDATWETVETIADTSSGSTTFITKKYKHTLGAGWHYKATSSGSTMRIVLTALLNRTTPGYVPWHLYTSSNNVTNFTQMTSADLGYIVSGIMPDLLTFSMAQASSLASGSGYAADLTALRTQWVSANSPRRIDFLWCSGWEPAEVSVGDQTQANLQATAARTVALANDDGYVSFETFFGDYTTASFANGWVQDAIHPSNIGAEIASAMIDRVTPFAHHPNAREGRSVNAPRVDADVMTVAQLDVESYLKGLRYRPYEGCRWYSNVTSLVGASALSSAISTNDFTLAIEIDVLASSSVTFLAAISAAPLDSTTANGLVLYQDGSSLKLQLRDSPNTNISTYIWDYFGTAYGGQRGWLVLRSNRSTGRFELFFDGKPAMALVANTTTTGGSGAPITTWSGVGTDFGIAQGATTDKATYYYGAMYWGSRLSDAEIVSMMYLPRPTTTPDFRWTFSEGRGRITLDQSGNGKDGLFRLSGASGYNLTASPTWRATNKQLSPPWTADQDYSASLIAWDNVVAKFPAARDMTLPSTPSVGDRIQVVRGATSTGDIRFGQAALHQIVSGAGATVGTNATTVGTSGKLKITDKYGAVLLECVRAEAGVAYEWAVVASNGTLAWT